MEFPPSARLSVRKYLGDAGDSFLDATGELVSKYGELWRLSELSFLDTQTVNLLFTCTSELYGSCILKACLPGPEVVTEINCLRAYAGKGYVRLWADNSEDNILLLERIIPGEQLGAVADYRERTRIMAELVHNLPCPWDGQTPFPSYRIWMEELQRNLQAMPDAQEMLDYLQEARRIYDQLHQRYDRRYLLHGDLHHANMLLNAARGYTIIDPKGVVDDPVMETARFLLNEVAGPDFPLNEASVARQLREMVAIIAATIGTPQEDILKSLYIDTALSKGWDLEELYPDPQAREDVIQKALATCKFVYGLL
ncbi:MAG: aminoglycoside phosphotransferase family protein [Symbiobacteriaceae bacterium]|nr:aminoglycoside phosphotransferase family protein [Symbiobacteriaceae bacterium]